MVAVSGARQLGYAARDSQGVSESYESNSEIRHVFLTVFASLKDFNFAGAQYLSGVGQWF